MVIIGLASLMKSLLGDTFIILQGGPGLVSSAVHQQFPDQSIVGS